MSILMIHPPHPNFLRGCAECQLEDGRWRRWNADALCVVCPIHKTLMWDVRPDNKELTGAIFLSTFDDSWSPLAGRAEAPELLELQNQLVALRKRADLKTGEKRPTEKALQAIQLYKKARKTNPGSAAIRRIARPGWAMLRTSNRETSEDHLARAFTVADAAALLPAVVPAVQLYVEGDDSALNDIHDSLWDECGGGKLIKMSNKSPENRETVEQALRKELDSGDAAA